MMVNLSCLLKSSPVSLKHLSQRGSFSVPNIVLSMFDIPVFQHIANMYREDIPLNKRHAGFYNQRDVVC